MNTDQLAQQTTVQGRVATDFSRFHELVVRETDAFMLRAGGGQQQQQQQQQRPLLFSQLLDTAIVPSVLLSRCAQSGSDNAVRPGLYSVFLQRSCRALAGQVAAAHACHHRAAAGGA